VCSSDLISPDSELYHYVNIAEIVEGILTVTVPQLRQSPDSELYHYVNIAEIVEGILTEIVEGILTEIVEGILTVTVPQLRRSAAGFPPRRPGVRAQVVMWTKWQ
jgi:uncharacterized protein YjeT (DUF2065 family)